ncbi:MAG: MBL fold metallo-hydrolase [Clostridia bacterium]|nr:MBL fold metallo-hydrolase [Clostridia bacterium]
MATKKTTKKGASKAQKRKQLQAKQLAIIAVLVIIAIVALILLVHFNVIDLGDILGQNNPSGDNGKTNNGKTNNGTPAAGKLEDIDMNACIKVHFIDVGQGDSILIELGTDTIILIDAGHTGSYLGNDGKYKDRPYGDTNVPKAVTGPYFEYLNEIISNHGADIDYLVATHRDSDHINMLTKVLDTYQVNSVFYNDCYNSSMSPDEYSNTVKNFETKVEAEPNCTQYQFETAEDSVIPIETTEYKFTVYSSGNDGFRGARTKENSMSLICMLEYGGRKVLFTGDAEVETEKWFIDKTGNDPSFDIDVLKVAHHGSSSSSCVEFLDYIHAEYGVISSGKNNAYGHPTEVVMNRLIERNIATYNTQDYGTITLYIDSEGDMCFVTEKTPEAAE